MKIIHFIDELKMGGAQTHLFTMCKENLILYPNHEIIVVSLFGDGELSDWFKKEAISVKVFDFRNLMKERSFVRIIKELHHFLSNESPDIVITHLTWSRLLANTAAFLNKTPTRIGFEQGDIYFNTLKFRFFNFISQFMFNKIIVCSETHKKWTHKTHKIKNSKIEVYHNCVDIKKFDLTNNLMNSTYEKPEVDFLFIAVGTLGKGVNKRMDINIKAIANVHKEGYKVGLVICGDGEQRVELQQLIEKLNMEAYIKLLGNRPDVKDILADCDGFCHAAPYEPFGIVAIEALAMGLPVILPNSGGIKEVLVDKEGGHLYESLNEYDLAVKMLTFVKDKDSAIKLGQLGRKNVEVNFSSTAYMKRFINQFYKNY